MKVIDKCLEGFSIKYPLERVCPLEEALFVDIETTGFTARSSALYLIGCAYYGESGWHVRQWMAEKPTEQKDILVLFYEFSKEHGFWIQFNGNTFDLPYLTQKCAQLELPYRFDSHHGMDLYRRTFPYKDFLQLPTLKQKAMETFLGVNREDRYSGGELIAFYQDYVIHPNEETLSLLLLHNAEDIQGMLEILPMLAYDDAIHAPLTSKKVQANHYRDADGNPQTELLIYAELPVSVPRPVLASTDRCFAKLEGSALTLRVPLFETELKYFYPNYKEYYYLPSEDLALHKSISNYVDKAHREPATARNCYTRKRSLFLQEWSPLFSPIFQQDYDSSELFFELTDEMKKNREAFASYASHVLQHIAAPKKN